MAVANKRSVMTLYSDSDIESHRSRIVLAEKGILVDIIEIDRHEEDEEDAINLHDFTPYNKAPVLVDRELILYQSRIIMEYLDERFPHPPLLPVYPVSRAELRLLMYRIEKDWEPLIEIILSDNEKKVEKARKDLKDHLMTIDPVFSEKPFFLSEEFSLVDCYVAPILWRLPVLGIELPPSAKSLKAYMDRVFNRDSFKASLTDAEEEMRMDIPYAVR